MPFWSRRRAWSDNLSYFYRLITEKYNWEGPCWLLESEGDAKWVTWLSSDLNSVFNSSHNLRHCCFKHTKFIPSSFNSLAPYTDTLHTYSADCFLYRYFLQRNIFKEINSLTRGMPDNTRRSWRKSWSHWRMMAISWRRSTRFIVLWLIICLFI